MKGAQAEKRLASQFITRFFKFFPKLQENAIDAMLDLCEDEDTMVGFRDRIKLTRIFCFPPNILFLDWRIHVSLQYIPEGGGGGGYSPEIYVGMCGPPLETPTLLQTKICDFLYPISDLTQNFIPYFRPDPYHPYPILFA